MSKPSNKMVILWVCLLMFLFVSQFLFISPFLDMGINYSYWFLLFIICAQFGFLIIKDPGYLKSEQNLLNLLMKYEPKDLCPECRIHKPPRSKHCDICAKCIMVKFCTILCHFQIVNFDFYLRDLFFYKFVIIFRSMTTIVNGSTDVWVPKISFYSYFLFFPNSLPFYLILF